jgi:hypothetical protein
VSPSDSSLCDLFLVLHTLLRQWPQFCSLIFLFCCSFLNMKISPYCIFCNQGCWRITLRLPCGWMFSGEDGELAVHWLFT